MLKLALRNLLRYRFRTGMTLAAIAFGVVGLVLSGGFVEDVFIQLGEALIHSQSGHIQISRTGYFASGANSPQQYMISDLDPVRRQAADLPAIEDLMARVKFLGLLNNGTSDWPVNGEGLEPDREAKLGSYTRITAGRQITDADHDGIMVGQGVAQALKLSPGQRITLLGNSVDGALNSQDFEVIGIFESFSKDYDARVIRITLASAHELLQTSGANALVLSLTKTSDTEATAEALRTQLDGRGLEVMTWIDLNDFYKKTVLLYKRQFGVLQIIVLAMVLLGVANSVNMSVYERVGEFGTLMALGIAKDQVFRLVVIENLMLGFIGATLGVIVGVILALAISYVGIQMPAPPNASSGYTAMIRIVPVHLVTAFAIGFLATAIASLLPAKHVSAIPTADALKENYS